MSENQIEFTWLKQKTVTISASLKEQIMINLNRSV